MIQFKFHHGLGDCANAAHLFALYNKLGHKIGIECTIDKIPLFRAAGCRIITDAGKEHPWSHYPSPERPTLENHWSGNKTAWNISKDDLPNIGSMSDVWNDLISVKLDLDEFVTDKHKKDVEKHIKNMPRPLVLLHTKGNTSPENKNYPDELHFDLYREILDRMNGTILLMDWDDRVSQFPHNRLKKIWKGLNTLELYQTIKRADCVIGIDSGVLHFSRFTNTPAIGIWMNHYPSHYSLPNANAVHLVNSKHSDWNKRRKLTFNILETPDYPTTWEIADTLTKVLAAKKHPVGPDIVLQQMLIRCHTTDKNPYCDRHKSFSAFFNEINSPSPLIVETGCIKNEEDWSAGHSTYILGWFVKNKNGSLISIDIDRNNVNFAKNWTKNMPVTIHHSDSRAWFKNYAGRPIDALYLDSDDTSQQQDVCLQEVQAVLPHLSSSAPILIDDCPDDSGRGGKAIPWLLDKGYKIAFSGYQVLLTKKPGKNIMMI